MTVQGDQVQVTGPRGSGSYALPEGISVEVVEGLMIVKASNLSDRRVKAMYGLTRANLANLVKGLDLGFEKKLELVGVGYRAQMQGVDLVMSLGFSHPVKINAPEGVQFQVAENKIKVMGFDKHAVGETAAHIHIVRPPEPYKGKGIRYEGEVVRKKAGKSAKAVGGATAK